MNSSMLRQLAELPPESIPSVLRILAGQLEAEEARLASQRERSRRSRDRRVTVTSQERDGNVTRPSKEEIPPTPPKEETQPSSSLRSEETLLTEKFEEAWKAYPRREGDNPKKPARQSFVRAVKRGAAPEAIIVAARAMARKYPERTPYIPQMKTWLNEERFNDENSTGPPSVVQFETVEQIRERVRAERAKSAGSDTAGEAGFREAL